MLDDAATIRASAWPRVNLVVDDKRDHHVGSSMTLAINLGLP
jgi:hypothetical protein